MFREYDKQIFADNLNWYMEKTGTKTSEVCSLLGVSKSTVSEWRNAKKIPRMDKIETLANHFSILKSDLIEKKNHDQPKEKTPTYSDGRELSESDMNLLKWFRALPKEKRDAIIALAGAAQEKE